MLESELPREIQEKMRQLELLAALPARLGATLELEAIRATALEAARELLRCDSARLTLHEGPGGPARGPGALTVTLRAKGRAFGTLEAHRAQPAFSSAELNLLETLGHQISAALESARLCASLKRSFYDTVEALAEAIEKKDRYTGGHTKRVVHYSTRIARCLGISGEELERIRLAALLHDVGKIGVEDRILKKSSSLESDEWELMQRHPELGFDILSRVEGMGDVIAGMRYHHERWDGRGYPFGLRGEEIPRVARVIAVADTYDAIVSTRPYRKGLAPEAALEEIVRHRGTQFDPEVVDAFVQAFSHGGASSRAISAFV